MDLEILGGSWKSAGIRLNFQLIPCDVVLYHGRLHYFLDYCLSWNPKKGFPQFFFQLSVHYCRLFPHGGCTQAFSWNPFWQMGQVTRGFCKCSINTEIMITSGLRNAVCDTRFGKKQPNNSLVTPSSFGGCSALSGKILDPPQMIFKNNQNEIATFSKYIHIRVINSRNLNSNMKITFTFILFHTYGDCFSEMVNTIVLITKQYIYKTKCAQKELNFTELITQIHYV